MSETVRKSHNVSVLMYHFVCPAKYRRVVIDKDVDRVIKETCEEIQKRYEIKFLEVGTDRDHVHFLIQSVPTYSPQKVIQIIKNIIAREVFAKCPQVKKQLWGGKFVNQYKKFLVCICVQDTYIFLIAILLSGIPLYAQTSPQF